MSLLHSTGSTVLPLGLIYLHPLNQIQLLDHKFYVYQEKIVPFNSDSESDDESQGKVHLLLSLSLFLVL